MGGVIRLDNLTLGYERHPAVHHLSGEFASGTLTAIVGPNGAGKSTLLKGILGLMRPLEGHILLSGIRRQQIACLPQQVTLEPDFPITVLEVAMMGHWRRVGILRAITRHLRRVAIEALLRVGLAGFEHRSVSSLSSGQRQRLLFARLMVEDAPVILLDEPFTAMDDRTTTDLITIVQQWHHQGRTIIAVLHDLEQVRRHFPYTLLLARRLLAWGETAMVLSAANLRQTHTMSEAWNGCTEPCSQGIA
ncbi:MAG: ABC transporter ATP-binding protein [Magnetococcales bacterium]|nr:ABC transporter ATP-binding protein [Magnetococcales bacterium]